MLTRWVSLLLVVAGMLSGWSARAETPQTIPSPQIPYEKHVLENGLELILHRDPRLPLVAVNVWYHVGPANEPAGRSGFAHLFEHLMFEGSKHVKDRFDELLEAAGATNVNGTTSWDRTNYFETVPREYLSLALWIESDRMAYLMESLDEKALAKQRDIVLNERRETYENAPYGPSTLALYHALFAKDHPYYGAVIGSTHDIAHATLDDVRRFYERFYAPSNATLVIAGDIDPAEARGATEHFFGSLPKRSRPSVPVRATPPLTTPRRITVTEPVQLGQVSLAWVTPPAYGPEDAPLEVLAAVLAGSRATELHHELIVERALASEVSAYLDNNRLASTFVVSATCANGVEPAKLEAAIDGIMTRIATAGPDATAVARAKRRLLVDLFTNLQLLNGSGGESGRAGWLQRFNYYLGDPGHIGTYTSQLEAVTVEDLQRVARVWLRPEARATVLTIPSRAGKN